MLTKNDLSQIREVVKEEVSGQLDTKLEPIKEDISSLKQDVGSLKSDVSSLRKDVKVLKRDVSQVKRDQSTMLRMLDEEQMQQRKRIVRLEQHVGFQVPE